MEVTDQDIICANFLFYNNFDSANLAKVENVKTSDESNGNKNYEFNLWTKHDCHGTEFQNTNRTWFYFGVKSPSQGILVKLNIINLNKQSKMFSQGMCPVFRVIPGHPQWERIRDKPLYTMDPKSNEFTLSFTFRTPENPKAITYIAFTYPFTYADLQYYLSKIDIKLSKQNLSHSDSIYYHRECAIKSLEGRRLELLTISSYHNITTEREDVLDELFPNIETERRPFKFCGKKVIFISARVHPGETPSSFVFNGFLNFLLTRDDPIAVLLRRIYVFKLIPMLNPDGVARGHYRMDTRGCNLNRVYLNPSIQDHPTIYAAKTLIKYYHNFYNYLDDKLELSTDDINLDMSTKSEVNVLDEEIVIDKEKSEGSSLNIIEDKNELINKDEKLINESMGKSNIKNSEDSGLFLYIDFHGHASKKGVFMYGNYFDNPDDTITCMLLPKLMSINDPNFHFTSCNFAERNMYVVDKKDGMSREGSGRVAVYKMTGLIRSYTLECNYNSGRLVNSIPARIRDNVIKKSGRIFVPPKYTPTVFEEVGAALGPSILDLTNSNPNSRLPNSQYRSLRGVKSYLRLTYVNNIAGNINRPQLKPLCGSIKDSIKSITDESTNHSNDKFNIKSKRIHENINVFSKKNLVDKVKKGKSNKLTCRHVHQPPPHQQQTSINRKSLIRNQHLINNVDNTSKNKIKKSSRLSLKSAMKSTGNRLTLDKNICKILVKNPGNKLTMKLIKKQTSVIKDGKKRIKLKTLKLLNVKSEIGESSKSTNLVLKHE